MTKDTIQERWNEGYYTQLNGAKILGFVGTINDGDGGDGFPRFMVKLASGENIFIEISRDPEGNGGGFIFGLPSYTLPEFRKNLTEAK